MNKYKTSEEVQKAIDVIRARNVASKLFKRRVRARSTAAIVTLVSSFLLATYGSLYVITQNGFFTVGIEEPNKYVSLSLYDNKELSNPTSHLSFDPHANLNNIDGQIDIPDDLDNYDGDHSGDNYLCYTFYVQNVGTETASVDAKLNISDVILGVDEAMRVRIYSNGIDTTYAKAAKEGKPNPFNEVTTDFVSEDVIYSTELILDPEAVQKYTIVVWLEGNDPECVNDILGGFVRLDMKLKASRLSEK